MKIPQKSSKFAHKVLQLLAFCTSNYCGFDFDKLNALAEAVIVDVEQLSFSPEKRLLDRNALIEICTCLITVTSEDKVILAHYSVKEYLDSERIQLGPATSFQISKIASEVLGTTICLVYLLNITYEGVCSADDYFEMTEDQQKAYHCYEDGKFPLLTTAVSWLRVLKCKDIWTIQSPNTAIIHNLLIRLFTSKGVHYKKWLDRSGFISRNPEFGPYLTHWKTQPGAEPNTAFAIACGYGLVETAKVILESNPNLSRSGDLVEVESDRWLDAFENVDTLYTLQAGTLLDLLDVAVYFRELGFVELLLASGANPNAISLNGCCKLLIILKAWAFRDRTTYKDPLWDIIESLLKAGADPNPRGPCGVAITPLQAASLGDDSDNMEILLDAGAQVNAVGDDRAIVAGIQRRFTTEADPFIMGDGWPLEGFLSQIEIRKLISTRGALRNYETPLRIVEKRLHQSAGEERDELLEMKDLLIENGGKSLNLYPGQNIPSHLEAYDYHTSMSKARISYVIN